MSYYGRGDYYRGDYYRGDIPGAITGAVSGFASGGLGGAIIGGLTGLLGGGGSGSTVRNVFPNMPGSTPAVIPTLQGPHPVSATIQTPMGSATVTPTAILPGGTPLVAFTGPQAAGGACPKGFKLNKSGYHLKNGQFVPARSRCVRFRSMNPLNPRALRKGLRRAEGFERIARRTVNALHRGPSKFKKKGRKR